MQSIPHPAYGKCRRDPEAISPTERWILACGLVLGYLSCMAAEALVTSKPKSDLIGIGSPVSLEQG